MFEQLPKHILALNFIIQRRCKGASGDGANPRTSAATQTPQKSGAGCTGAWSGIVKYERVFEDAFNENATNKNYSGAYTKVNRTQSKKVTGKIILDGKNAAGMPGGFALNVGGVMMGASAQTGRTNVTFTETLNESNQTAYTDSWLGNAREKMPRLDRAKRRDNG